MKRILIVIFVLLILGVLLKACLRQDIPYVLPEKIVKHDLQEIVYPAKEKNVTINCVDYLQSQAPVGNFGGELIISTIGEGPKPLIRVIQKTQPLLLWPV